MIFERTQTAFFLLISLMASAQVKPKNNIDLIKTPLAIYKQAKVYEDGTTAISALQEIIALEGRNSTYKDTLALYFYKMNKPLSCHLIAKELLEKKPTDLVLLELNALSLQQLNVTKEAITAFEKLFTLSKNKYHGYQLATLQFSIKRLSEGLSTITQTQTCKDLKDFELQFNLDKNQTQRVPLNAAIFNMKGLIAYELNDKESAKVAFDEALKISPDFELAKQNFNAIKVELEKSESK
ncbi:tetratricopeptide repeat protein [Lacihabitans soyangensis]|uniref:Tetratricopeptide repeat protein n=1 Tax=Lacihabitans soyangensis TaxID=869394 RepID=A0AAE3H2S1_9BACT|nr:hypothetical protein [Lacihabitans soyangensis]MCP9763713.1 hypothetical protein [Lacihabitans soyangensis]